jgi:hypothetical protein
LAYFAVSRLSFLPILFDCLSATGYYTAMKRIAFALPILLLSAHPTIAQDKPVGRLTEGTIVRMATSRKITWQTLTLSYSCRLKTSEKQIKQPLIYLIVLTRNADGEQLLSRYYTVAGSDKIREADAPYEQWGKYDAAGFTMAQLKTFHEQGWPAKVLSWGEPEDKPSSEVRTLSRKRMKVVTRDKDIKLLAWRLELWHDGTMLDTRSKPVKATLLRQKIPLNWHMANKGPFIPPPEPEPEPKPEPQPAEETPSEDEAEEGQ